MRSRVGGLAPIRFVEVQDFMARFDKHAPLFQLVTLPKAETAHPPANVIYERCRPPLHRSVGDEPAAQHLFWHMRMGASHDMSMLRNAFGRPAEILFATSEAPGRLIAWLDFEERVRALLAVDILAGYEWWEQRVTIYGTAQPSP